MVAMKEGWIGSRTHPLQDASAAEMNPVARLLSRVSLADPLCDGLGRGDVVCRLGHVFCSNLCQLRHIVVCLQGLWEHTDHDIGCAGLFLDDIDIVESAVHEPCLRILIGYRATALHVADKQRVVEVGVGFVQGGEDSTADVAYSRKVLMLSRVHLLQSKRESRWVGRYL